MAAIFCIAAFLYGEHSFQREQATWPRSAAIVQETRIHPIARFSVQYGSKPLYEIEVLASYEVKGAQQTFWLPLSEAPKPESSARIEAATLKGQRCTVRWSPTNPDQKIVELQ